MRTVTLGWKAGANRYLDRNLHFLGPFPGGILKETQNQISDKISRRSPDDDTAGTARGAARRDPGTPGSTHTNRHGVDQGHRGLRQYPGRCRCEFAARSGRGSVPEPRRGAAGAGRARRASPDPPRACDGGNRGEIAAPRRHQTAIFVRLSYVKRQWGRRRIPERAADPGGVPGARAEAPPDGDLRTGTCTHSANSNLHPRYLYPTSQPNTRNLLIWGISRATVGKVGAGGLEFDFTPNSNFTSNVQTRRNAI